MTRFNHVDLFSGIGGFALGLKRAGGFETVAFSEVERHACKVLDARFPGIPNLGDIEQINESQIKRRIGIITAGFPCQDLSVAGKRAGLGGKRSGLFWHVVRLASALRPEWLVLENVPGLLSSCSCDGCRKCRRLLSIHRSRECDSCTGCVAAKKAIDNHRGTDFAVVIAGLESCGYRVAYRVLDAQRFGLAQRRRRVWIVCNSDAQRAGSVLFDTEGREGDFETGEETRSGDSEEIAACLNSAGNMGGFRTEPGEHLVSVASTITTRHSEKGHGAAGLRVEDIPNLVAPKISAKWSKGTGGPAGDECQNLISETGKASDADRMRDFARLPARMDGARYRGCGNAVPVPVVSWIGRRIMKVSEDRNGRAN